MINMVVPRVNLGFIVLNQLLFAMTPLTCPLLLFLETYVVIDFFTYFYFNVII